MCRMYTIRTGYTGCYATCGIAEFHACFCTSVGLASGGWGCGGLGKAISVRELKNKTPRTPHIQYRWKQNLGTTAVLL
jgi:hypothetical protein